MLIWVAPSVANAQDEYRPDPAEVLRMIRAEKLDMILPSAMRDNGVDMWIHVTRAGDPDPLEYELGSGGGYLIFTDLGDRIERAHFGGVFDRPAVPKIEVRASLALSRAIEGYDYGNVDPSVYDEIAEFVAARDPQTIAVNFSDWLAVADGISYTQYRKLERILGPQYSQRMVSAEHLITDFRSRRTIREVVVQANTLEIARQNLMAKIAAIVPGATTIGSCNCDARVYYSAVSERRNPPGARAWIRDSDYVIQPGDFLAVGDRSDWMDFGFSSFGTDTKAHIYILRDGEREVPASLQYAWDQVKKAQGILRQQVRVGMTAGESLNAMIAAMEAADYIYTPLTDVDEDDYVMIPGGARWNRQVRFLRRSARHGQQWRRLGDSGSFDGAVPARPRQHQDSPEPSFRLRVRGSHKSSGTSRLADHHQLLEPAGGHRQRCRVDPACQRRDLLDPLMVPGDPLQNRQRQNQEEGPADLSGRSDPSEGCELLLACFGGGQGRLAAGPGAALPGLGFSSTVERGDPEAVPPPGLETAHGECRF